MRRAALGRTLLRSLLVTGPRRRTRALLIGGRVPVFGATEISTVVARLP